MQMQADILERRVCRSAQEDLSARGAALLGGLALGWWSGLGEISTLLTTGDWFDPKMDKVQRVEYESNGGWQSPGHECIKREMVHEMLKYGVRDADDS